MYSSTTTWGWLLYYLCIVCCSLCKSVNKFRCAKMVYSLHLVYILICFSMLNQTFLQIPTRTMCDYLEHLYFYEVPGFIDSHTFYSDTLQRIHVMANTLPWGQPQDKSQEINRFPNHRLLHSLKTLTTSRFTACNGSRYYELTWISTADQVTWNAFFYYLFHL